MRQGRIRFIPAPAGNRTTSCAASSPRPVHPRACGEQPSLPEDTQSLSGSSPRLRGTVLRGRLSPNSQGFIPAPAGNSSPALATPAPEPVHPRACGEQTRIGVVERFLTGSSPRLRGTVILRPALGEIERFIPAPAGNREGVTLTDVPVTGSSPRLRGTGSRLGLHRRPSRFIPAPAGNRLFWWIFTSSPPVHPRACGEQWVTSTIRWPSCGSSPRLRGTVTRPRSNGPRRRFIPAPAGNRRSGRESRGSVPVHPRACGEQLRK